MIKYFLAILEESELAKLCVPFIFIIIFEKQRLDPVVNNSK